jgi:hypothetical protein
MSMTRRLRSAAVAAVFLYTAATLAAQEPPPAGRGGRAGQGLRPNPPSAVNQQQVQDMLDGWALVQGQQVLQLSEDQTPSFVARYMRLQRVRRRTHQERTRIIRELQQLIQPAATSRDEVILAKLKELDDLNQRAGAEVRTALLELDGALSPTQRGRFRLFEERLEARKLELLSSVKGR